MEIKLTKEIFKAQAKKQHAALKARNVVMKLSDVQESLALAHGYENLATLYAALKTADSRFVDSAPLEAQKENLFIISWFYDEDAAECSDDVMGVYPPGTTIDDVAARDWSASAALRDEAVMFPQGLVLSKDTTVLENYATVPRIDRYGLPDSANEAIVSKWVFEYLGFRVPKTGVEINLSDTGDDGGNVDHILIWVNDEDSLRIQELFKK